MKIGFNWLHICEVMLVFLFQCCGRCAKTHEAHFRVFWENRIVKIDAVFVIVLSMQRLYYLESFTQFSAVSSEEFRFKMLP